MRHGNTFCARGAEIPHALRVETPPLERAIQSMIVLPVPQMAWQAPLFRLHKEPSRDAGSITNAKIFMQKALLQRAFDHEKNPAAMIVACRPVLSASPNRTRSEI